MTQIKKSNSSRANCNPQLPPQIKREKAIKRKEALEAAKALEEDTRLAEVIN